MVAIAGKLTVKLGILRKTSKYSTFHVTVRAFRVLYHATLETELCRLALKSERKFLTDSGPV